MASILSRPQWVKPPLKSIGLYGMVSLDRAFNSTAIYMDEQTHYNVYMVVMNYPYPDPDASLQTFCSLV